MSEKKVITFSDDDIFDSSKIEVVLGRAQLKAPIQTDNPTIETVLNTNAFLVDGFFETATKPSGTEIQYILRDGDTAKYFDGTNWVISDGTFAQSNLATVIDANRTKLTIQDGLKIVVFLHSDTGAATPIL